MSAILNNFLHYVITKKKKEAPTKIWPFFEKINGVLFFRTNECGHFECKPWANVFNALLLATLLGFLGSLQLNSILC